MNWDVLVTDGVDELLIDGLRSIGMQVEYAPDIPYDEVCAIISQYDGVVINSKVKANAGFLAKASRLKFIARLGSGLDIIDLPEAELKGIQVFSSPKGNCDAVAEHALGMLLSFLHKQHTANLEVKRLEWRREAHRGNELGYRRVGLIGFGNTGRAMAHKLSGLVHKIWVYDPYVDISESNYIQVCRTLDELIRNTDIISFHVQLTEETTHMADQAFFEKIQTNTILINTSRGKVVDTKALIEALGSKKLAGAALDVFENEKPAKYSEEERQLYKQLFAFDNVLVSPHVAGWTIESKRKIAEILLQQIKSLATSLEKSPI